MGQTTNQIESHIERTRDDLGANLHELEQKVKEVADWRHHFRNHPMTLIGANSFTGSYPARAMMFLNLLHTDKYLINLLNWGIENKHYKKVSDNVIDYAPGVDAKTTGYSMNQSWMFGNQLNLFDQCCDGLTA